MSAPKAGPGASRSALGIRARLFLVVTLVLGGIGVTISAYVPARAKALSLEALAREAGTVGRLTAHSVAPALLFADPEDARQILAGIRATAGVTFLRVIDPEGREFASVGDEGSDFASESGQGSAAASSMHRSVMPIVHQGRRLGSVHVGVSLAELEAEVARIRWKTWGSSAALFLLAISVTVAMGSRVIRPLSAMVLSAERISRGERDERLPVTSGDEVGSLAAVMNQMLENLLTARQQLEELNRDLEYRVQERTGELASEISERRRSQEALQRANERFELAASAVEGAIYDWDTTSDDVEWSDGLARVFGHGASGAVANLPWWVSKIHPDDVERVTKQLEADLAAGRDFLCEYRFADGEGRFLNVLDRGRLLFDASGRAIRSVGVMENITHLRQLEEQFLHSQRMEAVGRLAGGVAHDFNNLLTTILGYGEILNDSLEPSDPRRKEVGEIRKAGERASALTQQLLAFSRKQPVNTRDLDLRSVLSELEDMLRRLIGEDVQLETRIAPGRLVVHADRSQLDQVIINVAVNARDAMPSGGSLSICASRVDLDDAFVRGNLGARTGGFVLIEIGDTGSGMSSETLARIFEPFYTTKEVGKGTGLGMSIVYGIVSQSGGYVTVDSVPGQGTRVRIYLPEALGEPETPTVVAEPEIEGAHECLLIVEDEPALRAMLHRYLKGQGYEIHQARNGAHALQVARSIEQRIDLVLTDLIMPVMGGREMVDLLTSERPGLQVIYMSGHAEDRTRDYSDLASGSNFLHKPFALQQLLRKIRETLEGRS